MDLEQRYLQAVLGARTRDDEVVELTPSLLATAVLDVLPVSAAGISLNAQQLRVPLGWSDDHAAIAERHQTTLGDGPCLSAAATGQPVLADAGTIAERWPSYYAELERRTPFRSVAALPLQVGEEPTGAALDLYADRSDLSAVLDLEQALLVAETAARLLFGLLGGIYEGTEETLPTWLDDQPAVDRIGVWAAVGLIVSAAADLTDADALSRLRAYAYGNDLALDEAAARLVDQRVPVADVLG